MFVSVLDFIDGLVVPGTQNFNHCTLVSSCTLDGVVAGGV